MTFNSPIGIILPTYYRGSDTFLILKRCLDSIFSQSYSNFRIFLIGDDFEKLHDLHYFLQFYDQSKIELINIPVAIERKKYYNINKQALWSSGGANARNFGVNYALTLGFSWLCQIDHDDFWDKDHLAEIKTAIDLFDPDVIFTKSSFFDGRTLPMIQSSEVYLSIPPEPNNIVHSSSCINFLKIPYRYCDVFEISGVTSPSDAALWGKINSDWQSKKIKSIFINKKTCEHLAEGFSKK